MVKRFVVACDAKTHASSSTPSPPPSSSSAAAAAAAASTFESSFDNLDLLFSDEGGVPGSREDSGPRGLAGDELEWKGLGVQDSEDREDCEGCREGLRVYFPEISLSHALEVCLTCDVGRVTCDV
jgi:hypothetical protein